MVEEGVTVRWEGETLAHHEGEWFFIGENRRAPLGERALEEVTRLGLSAREGLAPGTQLQHREGELFEITGWHRGKFFYAKVRPVRPGFVSSYTLLSNIGPGREFEVVSCPCSASLEGRRVAHPR